MIIKTNNRPRNIVYFFELKNMHQKEMVETFGERAEDLAFFIYKNVVYCLDEFCIIDRHSQLSKQWDAAYNETVFSATLVRLTNCNSQIIVGRAYS